MIDFNFRLSIFSFVNSKMKINPESDLVAKAHFSTTEERGAQFKVSLGERVSSRPVWSSL